MAQEQFTPLLNTASELRAELERSIVRNRQLEELNSTLSSQFEQVQHQYHETKRKYDEARENYLLAQSDKDQILHESQQQYETLLRKLDEKSREFEILREKLKPQDLDSIRLKVQEDFEIPHRVKLNVLKTEIEQQTGTFHRMKRDLGNRIIELESAIVELQHDNEALKNERNSIVQTYKEQILKFHTNIPEKSEPERELLRRNHELKQYSDKVNEESRKLRQERDDNALLLEQTKTRLSEVSVQLRTKLSVAEADKTSAEERASRLTMEAERKDQAIRSLKQTVEDLRAQVGSVERQLGETETRLTQQKDEAKKELEQLKSQWAGEIQQLQRALDDSGERLKSREETLRSMQREMNELQLKSEGSEAELRRSHLLQVQESSRRLLSLETSLSSSELALRELQAKALQASQKATAECDLLKSDVTRLKREKEMLHERVRDLEGRGDGERKKQLETTKDLTSKLSSSEGCVKENRQRIHELEKMVVSLRSEGEGLRGHLEDCRSRAQTQSRSHKEALESLQEDSKTQLDNLTRLFRERWEDLKKRSQTAVLREREKTNGYKQKLLEIHRTRKLKAKLQREQELLPSQYFIETD